MSTELGPHLAETVGHELQSLRKQWWCFLILGIVLLVLGAVAICSGVATFFVSAITVVMFGFLLLFAGAAQVVSSFWAGKWSGFLLHLFVGILYVVVGYLIVDHPVDTMLALTLVLSAFLIVGGILRIVAALLLRFHGWGWVLLNGVIGVLLGVMINEGWPKTGLFVIGLFVGIELMLNGLSWTMFAFDLRRIPLKES
jgi:uncharacterized membrane protein HdeD (DUF308 family)